MPLHQETFLFIKIEITISNRQVFILVKEKAIKTKSFVLCDMWFYPFALKHAVPSAPQELGIFLNIQKSRQTTWKAVIFLFSDQRSPDTNSVSHGRKS